MVNIMVVITNNIKLTMEVMPMMNTWAGGLEFYWLRWQGGRPSHWSDLQGHSFSCQKKFNCYMYAINDFSKAN